MLVTGLNKIIDYLSVTDEAHSGEEWRHWRRRLEGKQEELLPVEFLPATHTGSTSLSQNAIRLIRFCKRR